MSQVKLSGSIIAGPASSAEGTFPGSSANIPLGTKESPKGFGRATGVLRRQVSVSAPAYVDLGEPGNAVTKANFLYLRSDAPVVTRLTTDDGIGGDVVAIVPVEGLVVLEFSNQKFLKLLEAQGNATIEYFLSGPE